MERSASSILRDLEIRVANLENLSQNILGHYQNFTSDLLGELNNYIVGLDAETNSQGDLIGFMTLGPFLYQIQSERQDNEAKITIEGPGTRGKTVDSYELFYDPTWIDSKTGREADKYDLFNVYTRKREPDEILSQRGFERRVFRVEPKNVAKRLHKLILKLEKIALSDKAVSDRAERKRLQRERHNHRVAQLEKRSSRRWPYLGDAMGRKIEEMIDLKYPDEKPWRDQEPISESSQYPTDPVNGVRMYEIDSPHTNGYYALIRGREVLSVHNHLGNALDRFKRASLSRKASSDKKHYGYLTAEEMRRLTRHLHKRDGKHQRFHGVIMDNLNEDGSLSMDLNTIYMLQREIKERDHFYTGSLTRSDIENWIMSF